MLSFTLPAFLFGLTALAIPIALHLMNRAIPLRIVFPSTRFIRRAQLPREGRRQLRDMLLLLLRLLLLTFIVLTFSRPVWQRGLPPNASDEEAETVFLIDVSASLAGADSVERVRAMVGEKLVDLSGQPVGLVLSANGVLAAIPLTTDHDEIRRHLAELNPTHVAGDHLPGLRKATQLFTTGSQRVITIVSDFQQTDWQLTRSPELPADIQVTFLDVSGQRTMNTGIMRVQVTPLNAETARVIVEARNYGTTPVTRSLEVRIGTQSATAKLELPPLQVRRTALVLPTSPTSRGVATIDSGDDYYDDDTYHFWAGVLPPVRILAVIPGKPEPRKAEELYFVRRALSVRDDGRSFDYAFDSVEAEFFFALDLEATRVLLLLGAAGYFREQEFKLVKSFLNRGGVAIVTPGKAAAHQFRGLRQYGLLAAEFVGIAGEHTRDDVYGLAWVKPESILGDLFEDPESTDLFLFPIYRYARCRPLRQTDVLLRMLDDAPALLESRVGSGRLFASTFAFHPIWSDLPMTGSFLPLIREMVDSSVPADYGARRVECGQSIELPRTLLGKNAVDKDALASADTREPGVIVVGDVPHEVNVSRRESVLQQVNLVDLQQRLGEGSKPGPAASRDTVDRTVPIQLWPHCASLAALFFLLEMLLGVLLDRGELRGRRQA